MLSTSFPCSQMPHKDAEYGDMADLAGFKLVCFSLGHQGTFLCTQQVTGHQPWLFVVGKERACHLISSKSMIFR